MTVTVQDDRGLVTIADDPDREISNRHDPVNSDRGRSGPDREKRDRAHLRDAREIVGIGLMIDGPDRGNVGSLDQGRDHENGVDDPDRESPQEASPSCPGNGVRQKQKYGNDNI